MSEITDMLRQPEPSDRERADGIRTLLCQLNANIQRAKEAGLTVEFIDLRCPTWVGYKGAVKITREL